MIADAVARPEIAGRGRGSDIVVVRRIGLRGGVVANVTTRSETVAETRTRTTVDARGLVLGIVGTRRRSAVTRREIAVTGKNGNPISGRERLKLRRSPLTVS